MRYRFGPFLLSPARRVLRRDDQAVRLIPRYFDLLLLLVEERHRAVSRQEIFDRVWADVVVSDGALTQAIRTIRRTLGDGTHEPQFIRTVSRHGYQFVAADVASESDDGPLPAAPGTGVRMNAGDTAPVAPPAGERERLLTVLLREGAHADATEDERYDAAVSLHELGTSEALERLDDRPGHEEARAILRDARWDAPGAGPVPLISAHGRAASRFSMSSACACAMRRVLRPRDGSLPRSAVRSLEPSPA